MSAILIVDDDDDVRKAICRIVVSLGFEAVEADDGKRAVEILGQREIDVIVSDIEMPGMDGMALLRHVARDSADIPVILVTGNPTLDTAMAAVGQGAFEYVEKPFDVARLKGLLKRAAHLRKMAHLRRHALAISGLPGGRAEDLEQLDTSYGEVLEQLWMAYQPIVRSTDGSVFAYEALMRSPVKALPHPGAVLHAAEYLGRLPELGRVVRDRAPQPMGQVPEAKLFINLHAEDLLDEALYDGGAVLAQLGSRVVVEITERADLDRVRDLSGQVERLRRMGFAIAIDDLGSGYAGLTSFVSLRPEFVKLDMSLVRDVDGDPLRGRLIGSMVEACRDLEIGVIAEGVETQSERDKLIELGVELLQGYLFAKPDRPFPAASW
jgi:EAL domain-containing protein (putative c-di-GMP-specific phosphodiesterase class I)